MADGSSLSVTLMVTTAGAQRATTEAKSGSASAFVDGAAEAVVKAAARGAESPL
jgi:hypothetical protein